MKCPKRAVGGTGHKACSKPNSNAHGGKAGSVSEHSYLDGALGEKKNAGKSRGAAAPAKCFSARMFAHYLPDLLICLSTQSEIPGFHVKSTRF